MLMVAYPERDGLTGDWLRLETRCSRVAVVPFHEKVVGRDRIGCLGIQGKTQREGATTWDCTPAHEAPEPIKMQHEAGRQRADIWRAVDVWIPQGSSEMEELVQHRDSSDRHCSVG
jgi:hypothetical protein